jgi:hypothetical protein
LDIDVPPKIVKPPPLASPIAFSVEFNFKFWDCIPINPLGVILPLFASFSK